MNLNAAHIILTYRCTRTCSHCFVFGSPDNDQVFTFSQLKRTIDSIAAVGGVRWVFFEGGEPMIYFALLIEGIKLATAKGLSTALTTNGFWITSVRDIIPYLKQLRDAGLTAIQISCDELHDNLRLEPLQQDIADACSKANIMCQFIGVSVPPPNAEPLEARRGETIVSGHIAFRGRAAHRLTEPQALWLWSSFDECPHENLADPFRIHIDPYGDVLICQGISIGRLEKHDLKSILGGYVPEKHPVVGPLLKGGPAELMREYSLSYQEGYIDACHLCYSARRQLRRDRNIEEVRPWVHYGERQGGRRQRNQPPQGT